MLAGRSAELKYLNTYFERSGSHIVVVYGRHGAGKTALLEQFVQDKIHYRYKARSCSEREQLYQWGKELSRSGIQTAHPPSFTDLLQAATHSIHTKKVVIIDDFQYLVKNSSSFREELVGFVRNQEECGQVMVILCSPSADWIEQEVSAKNDHSVQNTIGFLKVHELTYKDMAETYRHFKPEQCMEAYAILGGLPAMWQYFDDRQTIRDNICRNILEPKSFLYQQGERIISGALRETSVYHTLLAAISEGKYKLNDLYLHTGFSRAKISVYLKNLSDLELVEKVYSFDSEGRDHTAKGIYRIRDHFVHFHFTYLFPYMSALDKMNPEGFYGGYIAPTFKRYVSDYFRRLCAQKLDRWNEREQLPIVYEQIGEWIGKTGIIHIVARDSKGNTLVGLCNWNKPLMTYEDYERLLSDLEQARLGNNHIYLFSVGRFDEKLHLEAKVKQNIKLISLEDL